MSLPVISLLVFLALVSMVGAVVMGMRDLIFARSGSGRSTATADAPPVRLRRVARVADDEPPRGLVGRFDHWFVQMVRQTGLSLSATEAVLILVFCGAVLGGAVFVCNEHPMLATLGGLGGMGIALGYLMLRRAQHVRKLQDQLAPALDMLARSMRSGQSLDESLGLVGQRSPEPLAAEFRFCAKQLTMGLGMPVVMRSLVDRVRLFDVRIFTTTLTVHRQTGGNLAEVLERLAAVIRDRLSYRRQLRAVTGSGRMSAVLIAMIGPLLACYMYFFHPQYFHSMIDSPLGQALLLSAVVLEVIGLIWTARLLKPTY